MKEKEALISAAKEEADVAKEEADVAKKEAEVAKKEADAAKKEAQSAKMEAQSAKKEAQSAKKEADAAIEAAITNRLGAGLVGGAGCLLCRASAQLIDIRQHLGYREVKLGRDLLIEFGGKKYRPGQWWRLCSL